MLDNEGVISELTPQKISKPLLQGITALAAGFLGSDEDRRLERLRVSGHESNCVSYCDLDTSVRVI